MTAMATPPRRIEATPTRIAICVATYRRPDLLTRTLQSLRDLEIPADSVIEVRVIDNDAERSASGVVEQFTDLALRYAVEPERNIALARNRALDVGPADWIAFIDDDEEARPGWLCALCDAAARTNADAVFGPVHPILPLGAPQWAARSRLFEKRVEGFAGRSLPWTAARTSNALVRGVWFYQHGVRFSPEFGRSGGEDTDLFRRLESSGARFAAAPEAAVDETVQIEQCRLRWLVAREYRGCANFERQSQANPQVVIARTSKRLLAGTFRTVTGLPAWLSRYPERSYRGIMELGRAAGGFVGWLAPGKIAGVSGYSSSGTSERR